MSRESWWRRAVEVLGADPRSWAFAALGVALFVFGVLLRDQAAAVTLMVTGAGLIATGIVFPVVTEVSVGSTFSIKKVLESRDDEFKECFTPLIRDEFTRFARLLGLDAREAQELVDRALDRTYDSWLDVPSDARSDTALCFICQGVRGEAELRLASSSHDRSERGKRRTTSAISGAAPELLALELPQRAAILLRDFELLSDDRIAQILSLSIPAATTLLEQATTRLKDVVVPSGEPGR